MAKSDVEFLLRGDAAGIVLREGKRSEVLFFPLPPFPLPPFSKFEPFPPFPLPPFSKFE